jgi:arginine decarboxylase-like protein
LKAKVTKGMSAGKEEKFILSFTDLVSLIDCLKENKMAA